MIEKKLELYNQDFLSWWGNNTFPKRQVTDGFFLKKANKISRTLFKKSFNNCLTFQQRYITKMIAKSVF